MEKDFDFARAMDELSAIAEKVEDPDTPLTDIAALVARSRELIARSRDWLRTVREDVEATEEA